MRQFDFSSLQKRTVSGLIIGLPAVIIIWIGGPLFIALLFFFFALALLEWFRLSDAIEGQKEKFLLLAGITYLLSAFYSFYLLGLPEWGGAAFVLIMMVAGSDVGAYFAGKLIGGPKMMEAVSPNKTWAGFGGAMVGALLMGGLCALAGLYIQSASFALVAGVLIGACGQAGDLIISSMKRQAGVKDTGELIPGHGGLLDRIDSLLLCAPVFLILSSF